MGDATAAVARRLLGIEPAPAGEGRTVPDDLPRDQLFQQPLTCAVRTATDEDEEGAARAVFRVVVRDAAGKRCPDLFVQARVRGPEREATGEVTTDLLGTAVFRMAGPPGDYRIEVTDVAAHALDWDRDGSVTEAVVTLA